MQKEVKKDEVIKEMKNEFTKLSDLTSKEVKKFVRLPLRMNRRVNQFGLSVSMNLVLNSSNLIIPIVSNEIINGVSRRLRYYKPDRFINLVLNLDLPQKDERGLDINQWVFNPAIRFVKGNRKNGDEYHSIEIIFKQYHYETIFLNVEQLNIIESLERRNELKDYKNNIYKINWIVRPDVIEDEGEDLFEF